MNLKLDIRVQILFNFFIQSFKNEGYTSIERVKLFYQERCISPKSAKHHELRLDMAMIVLSVICRMLKLTLPIPIPDE